MSESLQDIAHRLVVPQKGILAADESSGTIKKRFDTIGLPSTEENRRNYREMLFGATKAMHDHISGVILFDETIRQNAKDGTPLVKMIEDAGSLPGKPLPNGEPGPSLYCAVIVKRVDAKTRSKTSINELLRD